MLLFGDGETAGNRLNNAMEQAELQHRALSVFDHEIRATMGQAGQAQIDQTSAVKALRGVGFRR